jgi:hypothetical protein
MYPHTGVPIAVADIYGGYYLGGLADPMSLKFAVVDWLTIIRLPTKAPYLVPNGFIHIKKNRKMQCQNSYI